MKQNTTNVSSLEALTSSIDTDKQVYRWFTLLVSQPSLRSKLTSIKKMKTTYQEIKKIISIQRLIFLFLLGSLLILIVLKQYFLLFLGLLFSYPLVVLHLKKKRCVMAISQHILSRDFEIEDLCKKTLYQICEIYSKKYKIPSLVDTIYAQDNISRKTIIFTFVFTAWIYPLNNIFFVFLAVILSYNIVYALMNTSFIYKNLK